MCNYQTQKKQLRNMQSSNKAEQTGPIKHVKAIVVHYGKVEMAVCEVGQETPSQLLMVQLHK